MFHFYSLLCEIASVPRKAPSAWISADRLAVLSGVPAEKKEMETAATGRTHHASSSRSGPGHLVSFNSNWAVEMFFSDTVLLSVDCELMTFSCNK
jgi:hypothetical protein